MLMGGLQYKWCIRFVLSYKHELNSFRNTSSIRATPEIIWRIRDTSFGLALWAFQRRQAAY